MQNQRRKIQAAGCNYRYYWGLWLLLITSSLVAQTTPPTSNQLKLVSWNIQLLPRSFSLFSNALRKKQRLRTPWIIEHCLQAEYDVLVFQEVFDRPLSKKIQRELSAAYPYQVKPLRKAGRLTSSGILIVSKWPIERIGATVYPKGVHEDGFAAKGCTVVQLNKEGKSLYIAGTHLQAGNSDAAKAQRSIQYRAIKTLLDETTNDSLPLIVTGDMNTRRQAPEAYQEMLRVLAVEDQPLDEERPYTIDIQNTWNPNGHNQQLDYVLLRSQKSALTIVEQKILRVQKKWKEQTLDLADHYGIVAILQWGLAPSEKE